MKYSIRLSNNFTKNWITRKHKPKYKLGKNEFNIVDLFCGCGGLTFGIIEALLKNNIKPNIQLAIDNNDSAINVFTDNFKSYISKVKNEDINRLFPYSNSSDLTEDQLALQEELGNIDLLVAGPPCQGHSDLNNSSRRDDPRNELYLSAIQAVKVLMPSLVIIENVPSVIHSRRNVVNETEESLSRIGYYSKQFIIQMTDLGVPQTRKRHLLIASFEESYINNLILKKNNEELPILKDYISDLENIKEDQLLFRQTKFSKENKERIQYLFKNNLYNLPDSKRPKCHNSNKHSYKSCYGRLDYDKPSQTITSGFGSMGQGRFVHPERMRTIIPREAARIQGFPDDFIFDKTNNITELRKMIANAVPPQMSYVFICNYLKYLEKEKI